MDMAFFRQKLENGQNATTSKKGRQVRNQQEFKISTIGERGSPEGGGNESSLFLQKHCKLVSDTQLVLALICEKSVSFCSAPG